MDSLLMPISTRTRTEDAHVVVDVPPVVTGATLFISLSFSFFLLLCPPFLTPFSFFFFLACLVFFLLFLMAAQVKGRPALAP